MGNLARWQLRDAAADLRIDVTAFPQSDVEARRKSEQEVATLLWRRIDPQVRSVLEDVYRELNGMPPRCSGDFSPGPDYDDALASALRFAAYSGRLRVERDERTLTVPVGPETDEAPPLGPEAVPDAWIAIELVDDTGKPVPNASYLITCDDGRTRTGTTNSDGKAREEGLTPGSCKVSFPGLNGPDWKLVG